MNIGLYVTHLSLQNVVLLPLKVCSTPAEITEDFVPLVDAAKHKPKNRYENCNSNNRLLL